jgi:hypothetical protein
MGTFRHFETRKQAKDYIAKTDPTGFQKLVIRKKRGSKAKKPYTVGTPLAFLHFT